MVKLDTKYRLDSNIVYIAVRQNALKFSGNVIGGASQKPVTNAAVRINDTRGSVDVDGSFQLVLPRGGNSGSLTLEVTAPGFKRWHELVYPGGNEIRVVLESEP